jgi:hypothetical protein
MGPSSKQSLGHPEGYCQPCKVNLSGAQTHSGQCGGSLLPTRTATKIEAVSAIGNLWIPSLWMETHNALPVGARTKREADGAFLVRISKCKLGSTGAANMASSGPSGDAFTRFNRLPCLRKGRDFLQYTGKNVRSFSRIVHTLHALIGAFSRRERTVGGRLTSPSRVAKAGREPSKFNYRLRPNSKLHQF